MITRPPLLYPEKEDNMDRMFDEFVQFKRDWATVPRM